MIITMNRSQLFGVSVFMVSDGTNMYWGSNNHEKEIVHCQVRYRYNTLDKSMQSFKIIAMESITVLDVESSVKTPSGSAVLPEGIFASPECYSLSIPILEDLVEIA